MIGRRTTTRSLLATTVLCGGVALAPLPASAARPVDIGVKQSCVQRGDAMYLDLVVTAKGLPQDVSGTAAIVYGGTGVVGGPFVAERNVVRFTVSSSAIPERAGTLAEAQFNLGGLVFRQPFTIVACPGS